ncbi:hypothetical protein PFLUV_G00028050 [Perca fluviatilis]|uniref:Uncharacterized protein n=1 Tax=Perca fluviatilis TaxID=8168 RepID=A0A6A5FN70_PERFL|nr:hypothetical protein PFLUV_G00028050 [Perca fluviatilis]
MPVNPTVMTRLQELKEVDYRAGRATAGSRKVRSAGLSQRRQAGREAQEPRSPSTEHRDPARSAAAFHRNAGAHRRSQLSSRAPVLICAP